MDWSLIIAIISLLGTLLGFIFSKVYKIWETSKKVEDLDKSVTQLLKDTKEVREDMIRVQTILVMKHKGIEDVFSVKHSPRMLNDLGTRMFLEMNGAEFLEKNKSFLFAKIEEQKPNTALDVENAAQWACSSSTNETFFNPVKDFVYLCPLLKKPDGTEFEFTLASAAFILGLKLRDLYIQEHPEFEIQRSDHPVESDNATDNQ